MTSIAITRRTRINRKISLLGACGLLAFTVIQLPHLADLWRQVAVQRAHREGLRSGISKPERLSQLDAQLKRVGAELDAYQQKMVDIAKMPAIQSELMELARSSGCQLRKVAIQSGSSETWQPQRDAGDGLDPEAEPLGEPESSYTLSSEQLSLSLHGTLEQAYDFFNRVHERQWLMRLAQVSLSREIEGSGRLAIEANLLFYKLEKRREASSEYARWRDGARTPPID